MISLPPSRLLRQAAAVVICAVLCAASLAAAGPATAADGYPARPLHMIVPFAPGGASDFVARILAPKLSEALGQQVIIENRAGAAGNIGMEAAAKSAPDGYTLFLGNVGTLAVNPSVFGKALKINPLTAFAPVTLVADTPDILIAHPSFPPSDLKSFIAYCRANSGKVAFASPGNGSLNRLEMEQLRMLEGGLDMIHVPYKGGAGPAVTDVIAGQVPVMFTTLSSAIGHLRGGRLKAYAVTTRERVAEVRDVPTLLEQGVNLVSSSWQAVVVPAKTPKPVVARLFSELSRVLDSSEVKERFVQGGARMIQSASPEELEKFMSTELQRWAKVVKQSGATVD